MSTSKYLCKRDSERYHFSKTIRCYPREGKGSHTGILTAVSEQEHERDRCKYRGSPKHRGTLPSSRRLGHLSEGPRAQNRLVCKRTFESV